MKITTSYEMKEIENTSMVKNKIKSIVLMENAARSLVEICREKIKNAENVLVVCGGGNNGGDGFAIARLIAVMGVKTEVLFVGNYDKMTPDCNENYETAVWMGISVFDNSESAIELFKKADIVIDAVIGTGLKNVLRENYIKVVNNINDCGKYVIAVDCPTGINSDDGSINGAVVKADETVTFYLGKVGMFLYPAKEYCGKVSIGEIGIIHENDHKLKFNILTDDEAKNLLPKRKPNSHKGTFGKLAVFAGSREMSGACCFGASAAYKVGCGLVKTYVVKDILDIVQNFVPEAVTSITEDKNGFFCKDSIKEIDGNTVLVGCGIGNNDTTFEFMKKFIEICDKDIIIDADGLNAISRDVDLLKKIKGNCVITPHIKEMSRLCGKSVSEVMENTIDTAVEFAERYGVTVVLKSAVTVIADPQGEVFLNITGNSSMAKGGSGDCLAGIIGGFAAEGMEVCKAAVLGCYINGKAGEIASDKLGQYSVTARDIINNIHNAILKIC